VPDPTTVTAVTNPKPNTCVEVKCDCATMWSLIQQDCYIRMGSITADMVATPIKDYETRAKRIAGTYARFYLETERGGNPKKKGRFYWMALGAFASKTVACTLHAWQVKAQSMATDTTRDGLGKGNFWLFCDIAGWHWYYTQFNDDFEMCLDKRDTSTLIKNVQAQTKKMPWSATALPKIKNLKVSKEIKLAFKMVQAFEKAPKDKQAGFQMKHLLAVADHEQGVILQPLIYDDPDFAKWVKVQRVANSKTHAAEKANPVWYFLRSIVQSLTPDLELVFSHACSTKDTKLKSVAPEDTKLENFESRMKWIGSAAEQFHELMQRKTSYMEAEIATMAGWYNMPDKK
jgi:hypothetical protein